MTINLETEVVASSFDGDTHVYTIERGGQRWTVRVPDDDFQRFGPMMGAAGANNRMARRRYLATILTNAMQGAPDA